jgi:3-methyladenine DNA glycosylase AlkD
MNNEHLVQNSTFLENEFKKNSNYEYGLSMSQYMKGRFPFYGIYAPLRKEIQRKWMIEIPKDLSNEKRWEIMEELWGREEREFHHVALDYLNSWNKKFILESDHLKIKWLISNNSWWDSVDSIASNYLGKYCKLYPNEANSLIEDWRYSDNMWLNRSCLIFQLKYGNDVDFELLKSLIIQYQHVKEFFIQKAIGWSLRQYSKFNPDAVSMFVKEINLQGIARREASKYL